MELQSEDFATLLHAVDERWRAKRISNRAYAEIARWAEQFRRRRLASDGLLTGVAYGEEFDNRLFEIFTLACVRTGLEQLGFRCIRALPLHMSRREAVMVFSHDDSPNTLEVHFQRGEGVAWTATAPRRWPDIYGIPDFIITTRPGARPIVIIDAKNRNRGPTETDDSTELVSRHATSDELHKILGYFDNFARRSLAGVRGPVGALIYTSTSDTTDIWATRSETGGVIATIAIDPSSAAGTGSDAHCKGLMQTLLRSAGVIGGDRPDGFAADAELQALHAAIPDDAEDSESDRLEGIHAWVQQHYGSDPSRVAAAEQVLEAHVLGDAWLVLSEEERRFLSTAEVFWEDHAGAVGMDFGPVVIELAKALESLITRTVVQPFRQWCLEHGREPGQLNTIGDVRAELQRVTELAPGVTRPRGARVLADYLQDAHRYDAVIAELLPVLQRLNPIRREAAHPHRVTSRAAADARAWLLGVGAEPSALSKIALLFSP